MPEARTCTGTPPGTLQVHAATGTRTAWGTPGLEAAGSGPAGRQHAHHEDASGPQGPLLYACEGAPKSCLQQGHPGDRREAGSTTVKDHARARGGLPHTM